MTSKKTKAFMALQVVFMAAAFILSIYSISLEGADSYISLIFLVSILGLLLGFFYFCFSYKKSGAAFYKGFMLIYFISEALRLIGFVLSSDSFIAQFIIRLIMAAAIIILLVVRDFGKKKSSICAAILVVGSIALAVLTFTTSAAYVGNLTWVSIFTQALADIMLAATAAVMVFGKFADKESRGRKV